MMHETSGLGRTSGAGYTPLVENGSSPGDINADTFQEVPLHSRTTSSIKDKFSALGGMLLSGAKILFSPLVSVAGLIATGASKLSESNVGKTLQACGSGISKLCSNAFAKIFGSSQKQPESKQIESKVQNALTQEDEDLARLEALLKDEDDVKKTPQEEDELAFREDWNDGQDDSGDRID